jgi:hypothetical protein
MRIKNWANFQHFKDRRPPWIKLYRDILDDIEWHQLDPLASKVLVMCWLIASENDGVLPDLKVLAFRLRMSEKQTYECVYKLSHWLEQDDISAISERYQHDALETEKEAETEKKKEKKSAVAPRPDDVSEKVWDDWVALRKRKGTTVSETAIDGAREEAAKIGWTLQQFLIEWCTRGSQGLKADWIKPQERTTFAQQTADIARVTVPGSTGPDPALLKIEEDRKKAVPPPANLRDLVASMRNATKQI